MCYRKDSDDTKYWLMKNSWGTTWGENAWIVENGKRHLEIFKNKKRRTS